MVAQSDIISAMVRSREYCRSILSLYDEARQCGSSERVIKMRKISECADALGSQLHRLPHAPVESIPQGARRDYIQRLCTEVGDMITRVMVLERECRVAEQKTYSAGGFSNA